MWTVGQYPATRAAGAIVLNAHPINAAITTCQMYNDMQQHQNDAHTNSTTNCCTAAMTHASSSVHPCTACSVITSSMLSSQHLPLCWGGPGAKSNMQRIVSIYQALHGDSNTHVALSERSLQHMTAPSQSCTAGWVLLQLAQPAEAMGLIALPVAAGGVES